MKILYISQFYYPEPHSLHKELVDTLVGFGHDVTVVTSYPSYPLGKIYKGWKQRIFGEWTHDNGANILRCPVWPSHSRSILKRGLHFFSFTVSSFILMLLRRVCPGDLIIVHHPPPSLVFVAWSFSKNGRIPIVVRIADLWPEFITGAGISRSTTLTKFVESFMRVVYQKSAHIIVASPGFKKRLVEKGLSPEKITFVPNNADETVYYPVSKDPNLRENCNLKSTDIVLLYAGIIGEPQRLDIAVDAMLLLKHRTEIKLVIIGDGSCKQTLVDKCGRENVDSVVFVNRVPPDQMNGFYAMADALLMQLDDNLIWNDTIPSKIYAYMLVNRPVIAALKGDGADIIVESNGGIVCDPGSASSLARVIEKFADMPIEQRESMGANNRDYAIKNFSKDVAVNLINDVLIKFAHSS